MENDINVKGVGFKKLFIGFWRSDTPKKNSEQSSEIDKEWQMVLEEVDEKEKSTRNGEEVFSEDEVRDTSRENLFKKKQVVNAQGRKKSSGKQRQENSDKERDTKIQEI